MPDNIEAHTITQGGQAPQHRVASEAALRAARDALTGLPEPVAATLRGLVDAALAEDNIVSERDVVMIIGEHWNGCLVLVTEVKTWGVQGFVRMPMQGDAYIRISNGEFVRLGRLPDDVGLADE